MNKRVAFLFDLDGVIVDTEPQYSIFWDKIGSELLHDTDHFGMKIKGNTLRQIFDLFFADHKEWQAKIATDLLAWEKAMRFDLIPGIREFLDSVRKAGIGTAIVTSSDNEKLNSLWKAHPDLREFFDTVVSADDITRSKPDPEGYLLAAKRLNVAPENAFVFEDSLAGLQAGRAGGMTVVGVATTLPAEKVATLADVVIDNFTGHTAEEIIEK